MHTILNTRNHDAEGNYDDDHYYVSFENNCVCKLLPKSKNK